MYFPMRPNFIFSRETFFHYSKKLVNKKNAKKVIFTIKKLIFFQYFFFFTDQLFFGRLQLKILSLAKFWLGKKFYEQMEWANNYFKVWQQPFLFFERIQIVTFMIRRYCMSLCMYLQRYPFRFFDRRFQNKMGSFISYYFIHIFP